MIARLLPERPRLRNLDILLAREGWKLVCLLRISPLMPFAATSYALGLSSVKLRPYLVGTLLSLPSLLGYVVIGHSAGALGLSWHDGPDATRLALLAVGGVVTVLATLRIGQIARRAIDSVTP
jgi:uncharacterized membrane protein YdjX (TVP38/TMEM64 family)